MRASEEAPHRQGWLRWLTLLAEVALLALGIVAMRSIMVATARLPNGDVVEYHTYALNFWTGHPIFTSLPTEYPPLAILPFSLTLAPPLPGHAFESVFSWWAAAAVIAGYLGYLRFSDRKRALAYFIYLVIGSAGTLVARFDIFPAIVTLAAFWATQRRHYAGAYLLLALGVLLKLYPIFLAPLPLIAQWQTLHATVRASRPDAEVATGAVQRRWSGWLRGWLRSPATWRAVEGLGLFLGAVGLGFAVAFVLNPSGALSEFTYASARPLQVESTPATILWLGAIVGIPAHPDFSFVSLNYVGPLDVVLKPLSTVALAAGCVWVYWRFARGRLSLAQAFLATICVVVVANKIFSPQYLIWITPFVAEVYGFDGLWLLIGALTTLIFPYLYGLRNPIQTVTYNWAFMPVVAIRNILLLSFTLRAILSAARRQPLASERAATMPVVSEDTSSGTPGRHVATPDRV
ncbi:MAG TPA: hypothetical protein VE338_20770 [Ktedonobacterales bacterium]|nr:hypothetical protein [Ktedonobacterales bacterium]